MRRWIMLTLVMAATVALAQNATGQEPDTKDAASAGPRLATVPVDESGKPIPRNRSWKQSQVSYLKARILHPALYFDSVQEKLANDDASADNVVVGVWAVFYEIVQFPAQMSATPFLWAIKPIWTYESTEP